MDEVLSQKELKTLLGIGNKRITLLINQGLPYIKVGTWRVFLRESVINWLRNLEINKPVRIKPLKPKLASPTT